MRRDRPQIITTSTTARREAAAACVISHTHNINMLPAWLVVWMSAHTCWLILCFVGFWKLLTTSPHFNFSYKQAQSVFLTVCYCSYWFKVCCWASLQLPSYLTTIHAQVVWVLGHICGQMWIVETQFIVNASLITKYSSCLFYSPPTIHAHSLKQYISSWSIKWNPSNAWCWGLVWWGGDVCKMIEQHASYLVACKWLWMWLNFPGRRGVFHNFPQG